MGSSGKNWRVRQLAAFADGKTVDGNGGDDDDERRT
jgi:hypothetical protein